MKTLTQNSVLLLLFFAFSCMGKVVQKPVVAAADPEETMTTHVEFKTTVFQPEIIEYWGYPAETIPVTTDDGYILDMHRIPFGKDGKRDAKRPVVFLMHGLEGCSANFITNLPNEAAGFLFADAGFDVWLGNVRGNKYSKRHTTLSPDSHEFWKFSWDEMAKYDLPAMVDAALRITNTSKLYYAGHSQGTLIMFSHLVDDTTFGPSKIHRYFALAPVGTVKHIKGLIHYMAEYLSSSIEFLYELFGEDQFLPSDTFIDTVARIFCGIFHHKNPLCDNILFLAAGPDSHQLNDTRMPVYLGHNPSGTSTQNMIHWVQTTKSGLQQMYDYGSSDKNTEHYGKPEPPIYDITKVNVPTHLYWSDYDWLADQRDVEDHLIANIDPEYLVGNNHLYQFNHMDFVWGLRAPAEVYQPMIEIIKHDARSKGYDI